MDKKELISAIVVEIENATTKKNVHSVLDALIKVVSETVASGEKVSLIGFGCFEAVPTKERTGRNPKTNTEVTVPAGARPRFVPGKTFRDLVNNKDKGQE